MIRNLYFFLLSGEHETLPEAELRSVLSILDPSSKLRRVGERVAEAETFEAVAREAVERAAYTKLSAKFLAKAESDEEKILKAIRSIDLTQLIGENVSTIAVRGRRVGGAKLDRMRLERRIGAEILKALPSLRVDLENPDLTIIFVSDPKLTVIGILTASKPKHFFDDRVAGRRPFSLPSAMQPDFSRAMINLARARIGGRILDPFAGTGGIMIEAGILGYHVYGVEIKDWIALGALKNLKHYLKGSEFILVGDSRKLMFREECFDAIVTDPPYGRSTTVPERSIIQLLKEFLVEAPKYLIKGGRISISTPSQIMVEDLIESLKLCEAHLARVHGSLERRVAVLEA